MQSLYWSKWQRRSYDTDFQQLEQGKFSSSPLLFWYFGAVLISGVCAGNRRPVATSMADATAPMDPYDQAEWNVTQCCGFVVVRLLHHILLLPAHFCLSLPSTSVLLGVCICLFVSGRYHTEHRMSFEAQALALQEMSCKWLLRYVL